MSQLYASKRPSSTMSASKGSLQRLDRNSTSFSLKLFEYLKNIKPDDSYSFLKYYQNLVREYMIGLDVGARGLLINHVMGMGKSILAVAIAMDLIGQYQVIMLLAKSLESNMRKSIYKYIALRRAADPSYDIGLLDAPALDAWINKHFSFVSMNAGNMMTQMARMSEGESAKETESYLEKNFGEVAKMPTLDGRLLIVDEAHNLFRAITNGSKNAIGLYDLVMKSPRVKLLFLTGTIIANEPFELVPCFNMLGAKDGRPILPESYRLFNELYVDRKLNRIKNKEKFQNRIMGLVSYIGHDSRPGHGLHPDQDPNQDPNQDDGGGKAAASSRDDFPEQKETIIRRVHMDDDQWIAYQLARDKEMEEGSTGKGAAGKGKAKLDSGPADAPNMMKPKSHASSTYRVKSRQLSNFSAPPAYQNEKDPAKIPKQYLAAAKFRQIVADVARHPNQPGILYSQFTGVGGLGSFAEYLKSLGWEQVTVGSPTAARETISSHKPDAHPDVTHPDKDGAWSSAAPSIDEYLNFIEREMKSHRGKKSKRGGRRKHDEHNDANGFDPDPDEEHDVEDDQDIGAPDEMESRDESIDGGFSLLDSYHGAAEMVGGDGRTLKFAVIDGEVKPEDRVKIQEILDQDENKHGGIIDLLLISATGAEGLDLKNFRYVMIMEPYWNLGRILQIIARIARYKSHIAVPEDERNVQPYIYLAIPPIAEAIVSKTPKTEQASDGSRGDAPEEAQYPATTDTELYNDSINDHARDETFVEATREVSIECMINGESYCRVCNPTGEKLFTYDPVRDAAAPDPCSQVQEKKVMAAEIEVDGQSYYYVVDEDSIYGYKIYKNDPSIDMFRAMPEDTALFVKIIDAIEAQ